MISAHRCGAGTDVARENTHEALSAAAASAVDFVEFDVQRCRDGVFVLYHDDSVLDGDRRVSIAETDFAEFQELADLEFTTLEQCLAVLAGRKKAHVDLKFVSPPAAYADPAGTWEVQATQQVLAALGEDQAIITTLEDDSVAAVRAWARSTGRDDLLVGLSLGRDVSQAPRWRQLAVRLSEVLPGRRLRRCGANLVVANKALARLSLARWARRHRLPLLVWTVDDEGELAHWLAPGRAWLVTTNHPDRALAVAAATSGSAADHGR